MSRKCRLTVCTTLFTMTLGYVLLGSMAEGCQANLTAAPASKSVSSSAKPLSLYTLTIARVTATKGAPTTAQVVLAAATPYFINRDWGVSLRLKPTAGVTTIVGEAKYARADPNDSRDTCRLAITLTANETGKKQVTGVLDFSVVTAPSISEGQQIPVTIELEVK